jgi:hypothetical protein
MKVLPPPVPRIEELIQSCYEGETKHDFPQHVKGYCDQKNYSVCLYQEKEEPITLELLQRYTRKINIWDGLEEKEKPVETDDTATFFLRAHHITLDKQDWVQYHFKDLNDAEMEQEDDAIAIQRKLPAFSSINERDEEYLLKKVKQIPASPVPVRC